MSDAPQTPPSGRGLRIALFVSLALNLLVVGVLAGLVIVGADRRSDGRMHGLRALGLGPFLPVLSSEDRADLGARLRENRRELGELGRPLGRAVRGFTEALRSEPFDRDRAEAALAAQREHGMALQERGHALLLDQIETMSPEARALMADRIETALRRASDRRFGGGGSRPSE